MSMFNFTSTKDSVLITPEETVSGDNLNFIVNEKLNSLEAEEEAVHILTAAPNIAFVSSFLACLRSKKPVAVLSENLSTAERSQIESELLECTPHPQTAVILFTSGSTGKPRGVQLSQKNILANISAVVSSLDFKNVKSQTLFLPLSYSFGLLGQLLPALHLGIPTYLLSSFAKAPEFIEKNGMFGMWSGVPSHWIALLQWLSSKPNLTINPTHIVSAGGRLDKTVREKLCEKFVRAKVYNNYGLTEASPRILSISSESAKFFSEAAGYAVGDWRLRTSDEGLLEVYGSQIMLGYLNDKSRAHLNNEWLRTGDLAVVDEDGCVQVRGRNDDLVKVSGERVALSEIENALNSIADVQESCVLATPHPVSGSRLEAFLQLKTPTTRENLVTQLKTKLSAHKIPHRFLILAELPHNANGKLDRKVVASLRDRAQPLE